MSDIIERLDFTGPPPGLRCDPFLWAQYMAEHDPPGMVVAYTWGGGWTFGPRVDSAEVAFDPQGRTADDAAARAAAWSWYRRRVELADAHQPAVSQGLGHLVPTWPGVLGWTEKQVAAAEACLIDDVDASVDS